MYQLAKYATSTTIYFSMVKRGVVDLAQTADWTPATGDTKVSINGGTLANTTNNPAIVAGTNGVLWSLTLTTGELTGADIRVQIVDTATKAVEDQSLTIYTYGNASAKFVTDFSAAAMGAVMPTTAGRTLDVSATGEAGVDWANVGSPTTTVNMTGTKVTANVIEIGGSTSDLAKFVSSLATAVRGTVSTANAAGDSTHFRLSDYTEATASHLVGKQVWATTGAMAGQWLGTVSAYALTSGEGALTVTGSPTAETLANGVIVYIV